MGIAAAAAELLRSDRVRFQPALVIGESGWTLRDALLTATGCHRVAGTLPYWEWEDLDDILRNVRDALAAHTNLPERMDIEQWANQPRRSIDEVLAVLDAVAAGEDIDAPDPRTLRPWCSPKTAARCRIPYIPLAAVVHAWGEGDRPFSSLVDKYALDPTLSSWEALRRIDPVIRDLPPHPDVGDAAWDLREWLNADEHSHSPIRWLLDVTKHEPTTDLPTLRKRAVEEAAALKSDD